MVLLFLFMVLLFVHGAVVFVYGDVTFVAVVGDYLVLILLDKSVGILICEILKLNQDVLPKCRNSCLHKLVQ